MIITIVGSMQFYGEYERLGEDLVRRGHEVILPLPDTAYCCENVKLEAMLDFNRNLIKSDAILEANFPKRGLPNYLGVNSIMEAGMAFNRGKKIYLLNGTPEQCRDEFETIGVLELNGNLEKLR